MHPKRTLLILLTIFWTAMPLAADWTSGVAAFKSGDLETAEAEFRAMADQRPDWPGGHLMLGQTLLRDGRTAEALGSLEHARELAPGDLRTAFVLSQTYFKLERFAEAAEALGGLDPASLPAPQKLAFYKSRAAALSRSGREAKALPDLEEAAALEPNDAELHRQIARTAKAAGRVDLAIAHYGRATEIEPGDVASMRSLVQLLYDRALAAHDSGAQAALCQDVMPHARRLVELDDAYEHLVLLAESARCVGLHEVSREALRTAAAARPASWWPRYALGRAEVELGAWAEAEAAFEAALTKNVPAENKADVQKRLGYVYERQERLDEAQAQYRLAGDAEGLERVEQNLLAKKEEETLRALAEEKARLEKELADLEKSGV